MVVPVMGKAPGIAGNHGGTTFFRESRYFFTAGGPPSVERRIRFCPKTVEKGGMSSVTTAFAAIRLQAPIVTGPKIFAPEDT